MVRRVDPARSRHFIKSEDLYKAGSLALRGAETSAIFDTLNGSNGNRNKRVFCLGCYDRDFECLGEFTKIEGRNKMKITVNGSNGFIGSKLVTKLLEYGHKVVSLQPETGTSSKPMLALAFLITSTLITTSTLMAQKAVTPPTGARNDHAPHNERSGRTSRRASSDVHRGLSAGLFEPYPPP